MSRFHTLRAGPGATTLGNTSAASDPEQASVQMQNPCRVGIVTVGVIITCSFLYFLQLGMKSDFGMANCPSSTAYFQSIHNLFTHAFHHLGFLHLLFNMVIVFLFCNNLEHLYGSLPMLGLVLLLPVCSGLLYSLIFLLASTITGDPALMYRCVAGYSGNIFAFIWLYFVSFNIRTLNCCGICTIPARYYPFILLLITSLFNTGVSFVGHLTGLLSALLYHYGFLNYITIPRLWLVSFEEGSTIGRLLSRLPAYAKCPTSPNTFMEQEQFRMFKSTCVTPPPQCLCSTSRSMLSTTGGRPSSRMSGNGNQARQGGGGLRGTGHAVGAAANTASSSLENTQHTNDRHHTREMRHQARQQRLREQRGGRGTGPIEAQTPAQIDRTSGTPTASEDQDGRSIWNRLQNAFGLHPQTDYQQFHNPGDDDLDHDSHLDIEMGTFDNHSEYDRGRGRSMSSIHHASGAQSHALPLTNGTPINDRLSDLNSYDPIPHGTGLTSMTPQQTTSSPQQTTTTIPDIDYPPSPSTQAKAAQPHKSNPTRSNGPLRPPSQPYLSPRTPDNSSNP